MNAAISIAPHATTSDLVAAGQAAGRRRRRKVGAVLAGTLLGAATAIGVIAFGSIIAKAVFAGLGVALLGSVILAPTGRIDPR